MRHLKNLKSAKLETFLRSSENLKSLKKILNFLLLILVIDFQTILILPWDSDPGLDWTGGLQESPVLEKVSMQTPNCWLAY